MTEGGTPSTRSVLATLTKERLLELARDAEIFAATSATKPAIVETLATKRPFKFGELLQRLRRDELRIACREHRLDDASRSRPALVARLLQAHGAADSVMPVPRFAGSERPRELPTRGDVVRCRTRQWLVEDVALPHDESDSSLVRMVCLDDDAQGRPLEVLWERELGARVMRPEVQGLGTPGRVDPPRWFAAYLHALKWNAVTATDGRLFQSPYRAGIKLLQHQLTPLRRALQLPRANLFIADDVGLGKTIEAGLVMQELLLRQRVDLMLIVCPPSVALQWRDEMRVRFGLQFEIYNRTFVARRRRERGFAVNPWSTHARFIVSYQTLRRPEHRDPLLAHLGDRARKSMLVLDEAHTAAPADAGRYATDSDTTTVIRDVAPRFENRLFLSATPHNGHSNSFSALMEMLDPQRFTRVVEVNPAARDAVMVRRLKEDLRRLGVAKFPRRDVVRIDVTPSAGDNELRLARMLSEYSELMRPEKGRGRLVFVNLQKRLLSSVEAFHRTLEKHAEGVGSGKATVQLDLADALTDDDEYGPDDDALDDAEAAEAREASRLLQSPEGRARSLLTEMLSMSRRLAGPPDAKALALLEWIREHQCAAIGGAAGPRTWKQRKVLIFTEYGDTKRWLRRLLDAAFEGTERAEERILELHGGMGDDKRAAVQEAFNDGDHPVRILLATDAAREGVNLQGACADLFHFDVPWNPARLEQRNGRIDRTLQEADVVSCHYFFYPDREEDAVLDALVKKVDVIRRELGSLGSVLMEQIERATARGIDKTTRVAIEKAESTSSTTAAVERDLELSREQKKLRREIDEAGRILESSGKIIGFDPLLLREAIDVGLELAGIGGKLEKVSDDVWKLPPMTESWDITLDSIRPPRDRDEQLWDWRKKPLPPVTFTPAERIGDRRVHLHLAHPLVQRVLSRFVAQGFSAHDLSRVTIVRSRHDHVARVVAFGRLSLFGPGATRLHDQLVSVAAPWLESGGEEHLAPYAEDADRRTLERLDQLFAESPGLDVTKEVQRKLLANSVSDFATLWRHIKVEAEALAHDAEDKLRARGQSEAAELRKILESQRLGIERALRERSQRQIPFEQNAREARKQYESETRHLEGRIDSIAKEVENEPPLIESLYRVSLVRLEPVGLVYVWPATRGG